MHFITHSSFALIKKFTNAHTHTSTFPHFFDSFQNTKSIRESKSNYSITISAHICYIAITIPSATWINALFWLAAGEFE